MPCMSVSRAAPTLSTFLLRHSLERHSSFVRLVCFFLIMLGSWWQFQVKFSEDSFVRAGYELEFADMDLQF